MTRTGEGGSALIIALLVTFILSLLGVSFLVMAKTESSISHNERLALQTLYMAEAGARVVQGWFDRPGNALGFPPPAVVDRSLRLILDETDPYESAPLGSAPLYKQGVDLDGIAGDDLFERPYRGDPGDLSQALMGLEEGPDMRIDDEDPAARQFLLDLSATLLGDTAVSEGRVARVSRIDVFAPPYVQAGASWSRLGIGTIAVTARLYRTDPAGAQILVAGEPEVLAQRTVAWVLNEIPYKTPVFGSLHTCGNLELSGSPRIHWGAITATGSVSGYDAGNPNFPPSLPRSPSPHIDRLWTNLDSCVNQFVQNVNPAAPVIDPWLRLIAGGAISTLTNTCIDNQGYTSGACDPGPGATAGNWPCCNHCNKQPLHASLVMCPADEYEYDYDFWKNVATSGGRNVYYLVPVGGDQFSENGIGPVQGFAQITNGRQGVFFFDTTDGEPPRDDDLDGDFDNLTAELTLAGSWQSAGYIFVNSERVILGNLSAGGAATILRAPGEPFNDADGDLVYDAGEAWINLEYPTTLAGVFRVDATEGSHDDGSAGVPVRNARGPAISQTVSFRGILYNTGSLTASGTGTIYGSVVARGDLILGAGGPDIYWADELGQDWPPVELDLPRVTVTRSTELPWGLVGP